MKESGGAHSGIWGGVYTVPRTDRTAPDFYTLRLLRRQAASRHLPLSLPPLASGPKEAVKQKPILKTSFTEIFE